ncbi:MAG: hypothetical protein DWI21_05450 [Planctomycetota bacterium]|nr:MAG: hypothetical protein DWI21_05450 [Planctomycetota bacterium]
MLLWKIDDEFDILKQVKSRLSAERSGHLRETSYRERGLQSHWALGHAHLIQTQNHSDGRGP